MRQGSLFTALIVAAALVAGCGGGQAPEDVESAPPAPREVSVSLDGALSPANVAVQVAIQKGYFSDANLSVYANPPVSPRRPVNYVISETVDLGLTQQPQVVLAGQEDAPVVAVGSLISQPTAAMIWLRRSKIRGIADLAGKTIAVPGIPYQEDLLENVLARAGLGIEDVEIEYAPYELVPALLGGRADAIFGGSPNLEGIALRDRGAKPVIRRVQDLGVPSYDELMVIARGDWAAEESQTVRDFMAALTHAAAVIAKNPEVAVEAIEEQTTATGHQELEDQVEATVPLLSQTGQIDAAQADGLVTWMHGQGMISRMPTFSELFTNDYLPGAEG